MLCAGGWVGGCEHDLLGRIIRCGGWGLGGRRCCVLVVGWVAAGTACWAHHQVWGVGVGRAAVLCAGGWVGGCGHGLLGASSGVGGGGWEGGGAVCWWLGWWLRARPAGAHHQVWGWGWWGGVGRG